MLSPSHYFPTYDMRTHYPPCQAWHVLDTLVLEHKIKRGDAVALWT